MAMSADIKPSKRVNIQETFVVVAQAGAGKRPKGGWGETAGGDARRRWQVSGGVDRTGWRKAVGLAPTCRIHKGLLTIG
jgi:hypothetical protein